MLDYGTTSWGLPLTAFVTGLMGSLHCLGMCGGVSGSVALASASAGSAGRRPFPMPVQTQLVDAAPVRTWTAEANVLAFNAGRIASYAVAGALAGTAGGIISGTAGIRTGMFLFANLMIVLTGLYLLGIPQLLAPLERAGGIAWQRISPLTRSLLPLRSAVHAAAFGALWGWIPCGMVYAMILSAMSAGSAAAGMLTMFTFGAGTLPAMLTAGFAAGSIRRWTRHPRIRLAAGLAVVGIGLFGFARLGSLDQLQAFGAFCSTLLPGGEVAASKP